MTRRADPRETRTPVPAGELPPFDPVPRRAKRHDGWTVRRQRDFIEALADTGSVAAAAKAVNMSTEGAYMLRRAKGAESFRAAWEAALDFGVQRIEDVAMDRALNGVESPVYSYGKLVGTRTVFNDRLLMFILRNRAPKRFSAGTTLALNQRKLEEMKREWLMEEARETEREAHVTIDAMVRRVRAEEEEQLARLSPRALAAKKEYDRLAAEDAANGYDPATDPDHPCHRDDDDWRPRLAYLPPMPGIEGDAAEDERDEDEPEQRPTGPKI